MYRHAQFTSGVTQERFLLGSALGSDAHAVTGGVDLLLSLSGKLSLEAAWDRRSLDQWGARETPTFHYEKVADGPEEERVRARLSWERRPLQAGWGWAVEAGAERVSNFAFQRGAGETNALIRARVEWVPRG